MHGRVDTVIHEVRDGRKRRFTSIDNEILDYADLTASELCVYLALCRFASYDTGQCFPGVETLAKKARCSERTVKDCIKALEAKGYISVQRGAMGKTKRRNIYTILDVEDTPAWEAAQADRKAKREMAQNLPHSGAEIVQNLPHSMVQNLPHSGAEMVQHLPINNTSNNRTIPSIELDPVSRAKGGASETDTSLSPAESAKVGRPCKPVGLSEEFEAIWSLYPNKRGKGGAFRYYVKWRKAGYTFDQMRSAVINYRAECQRSGTDPRFIKHGSTFFGPDKPFADYVDGIPQTLVAGRADQGQTPVSREESLRMRSPALARRLEELRREAESGA